MAADSMVQESDNDSIVTLLTVAHQMTPKDREKLVWIGQGIAIAREYGGKKDER